MGFISTAQPWQTGTSPEAMPGGDPAEEQEFNEIFEAIYRELKRLAMAFRGGGGGITMSATDIVNDAYLKLLASPARNLKDHLHIKRIAARAMRQILIDAARRKHAEIHGGLLQFVSMTHAEGVAPSPNPEVLDLHLALQRLAEVKPRLAEIVELRYFGGLSIEEIRQVFGVSDATVERQIRTAMAWLNMTLNRTPPVKG